jgi:eukaryotic-like serine/threonine-protein kinase
MDFRGRNLGNYQITHLIGHGGFADVYLGNHIYLRTQSAIKVLHTRVGAEQVQSFLSEAQIIARLTHPNIVRVLDFGIEQEIPYLVLEYAPNGTLRRSLPREGKLPLSLVIYYTKQIASALQYAHDQHLIHRDVKPENLLLGRNYEVLLSDFGISTFSHTSKSHSTEGISGTVAYMAPEQVQGKARPASDQYALAVIVYEWLTGRCPFTGSFAEVATQHLFVAPTPPRSLAPEIPVEVEQVLLMGLAKAPEARFLRVDAFANALEQASLQLLNPDEMTFLARRPDSTETRTKLQATLAVAAPLLPPAPPTPSSPTEKASPYVSPGMQLPAVPMDVRPRASQNISRRGLLGGVALAVVLAGGAVAVVEMGLFHTGATSSTPLPGSTPSGSHQATASPTAPSTPGSVTQPAPEPTAQPPNVGSDIVHLQATEAYSVAWDSVSNRLASCGNGSDIHIWNPANGQTLIYLRTNQVKIYNIAWSPNGQYLAAAYSDGSAGIWNIAQGSFGTLLSGVHSKHVNTVAWSPNGRYLATSSSDHTVAVWDVASGSPVFVYRGHGSFVNVAFWSPSGDRIASAGGDATVQVWDASSGRQLLTYQGHSQEVVTLAWSPNGSRIVSGSIDTTAQVWDASSGQLLLPYTGHSSYVVAVAWSHDGQKIVSGGGDHSNLPTDTSAQVWDPTSGNRIATYTKHTNEIEGITWSPDSQFVASASDDYTVRVWKP